MKKLWLAVIAKIENHIGYEEVKTYEVGGTLDKFEEELV